MSGLLKKLKYAGETVKDVAIGVAKGEELLCCKEEEERRLNICKGCPHYVEFMGTHRCNECNCFSKLKVKVAAAKCPLDKWKLENGKK